LNVGSLKKVFGYRCHHLSVLVIRGIRGPCLKQASRGHQDKEGVGKPNSLR
jgi:hypothetical protein